jgi:multidrug resistance protein, MATE family
MKQADHGRGPACHIIAVVRKSGSVQVDAHVALLTVNAFTFVSFPFGIATAASIRVGNLLGSNQPKLAATSAWCAVALGGLSMLICGVTTFVLRHKIGLAFINDAEVANLVAKIAPFGAFLMLFDGVMGTTQV